MRREGKLALVLAELATPARDTGQLVDRLARHESALRVERERGEPYFRTPERQVRDYLPGALHRLKARGLVTWDSISRGNANSERRNIRRTEEGTAALEQAS